MFNGFIPFSLIVILNTLLFRRLKVIVPVHHDSAPILIPPPASTSSYKTRTAITPSSNRSNYHFRKLSFKENENKRIQLNEVVLAKVNIAIAVVFIIFHSVKRIPNIYELIQRIYHENGKIEWPMWIESITSISHFLIVLNSSVNFYIYSATHYFMPRIRYLVVSTRNSRVEMP